MAKSSSEVQLLELKDMISQLNTTIKMLNETINRQQKENDNLKAELAWLYWSSFLVTLCSEIMLYIETPLVSYSYSLNEVSHSCTS